MGTRPQQDSQRQNERPTERPANESTVKTGSDNTVRNTEERVIPPRPKPGQDKR